LHPVGCAALRKAHQRGADTFSVVVITAVTAVQGTKSFGVRRAERKQALFRWTHRLFFFVPRFFLEPSKKKWGEKNTLPARRADFPHWR